MAHLLHIDLLEQRTYIDALDELHDDLLQPLVINLNLIVLLNNTSVVDRELLALLLHPLFL